MARFPVVLRGYDRTQVDALMRRVDTALKSDEPGLTADEVRGIRFTVVMRGYDQRAVDNALYEAMRALRARAPVAERPSRSRGNPGWLINWIENAEFSGAGVRSGYDVRDVDAFLDRVIAGLRGTAPPVTARDVRESAFRTVRLSPGYDEQEVDKFLAQLAAALEAAPR